LTKNSEKVKVFDAKEGGNEVLLDGNGKTFAANQEVVLWVEGVEASDAMRDIIFELALVNDPGRRDVVKGTVIWVELSARYVGQVTPDNASKDAFIDRVRKDQLDGVTTHWTAPQGGSPSHIGIGNVG
jgi:hypothetical protein